MNKREQKKATRRLRERTDKFIWDAYLYGRENALIIQGWLGGKAVSA